MYHTYAIRNDIDEIYIGQTDNLETRLKRHNGEMPSKKKSYTSKKRIGNWKVFYQESFPNRSEAMKREKQLKSYQGRKFLREIIEKQKS